LFFLVFSKVFWFSALGHWTSWRSLGRPWPPRGLSGGAYGGRIFGEGGELEQALKEHTWQWTIITTAQFLFFFLQPELHWWGMCSSNVYHSIGIYEAYVKILFIKAFLTRSLEDLFYRSLSL
jgi:hypothetical protein